MGSPLLVTVTIFNPSNQGLLDGRKRCNGAGLTGSNVVLQLLVNHRGLHGARLTPRKRGPVRLAA